ncbi:RfaG Glycosyltransferase [Burkholderiaceae bacterium]
MSTPRRFIAWHPVLTDHQAYTYQALAKQAAAPLTAYVLRMEEDARRAQGWCDTQVTSIERRLIPASGALRHCYQQLLAHRNDVHFFGSTFESPILMLCLLIAACLGIEFYLISEPYSPKSFGYFGDQQQLKAKLKTRLRPMLYWLYAHILLSKVAGVFAISQLALTQYRQAGIPGTKLFPFGYFIPQTQLPPAPQVSDALHVVFIGALIQRKGLDVLIDAVRQLQHDGHKITLDIFGPGDANAFAMERPRINYRGLIPFGQAQEQLADYDLMVLPSHYDGWGVVVNEALCAGIPVVCSDQVGASILASKFNVGKTFVSGDSQALAQVLIEIQGDKTILNAMRRATVAAAAAIQPEVAAAYMLEVIAAPTPDKAGVPSPWYPLAS